MRDAVGDPDTPITYVAKFNEYGVRVLDDGSSFIQLKYCPWSGGKLPESLRDKWFSEIKKLGLDPAGDKIPEEFTDERWYTNGR